MKLKESIGKSINEYLDSTTIHGFSYLSSGRNILEKLAWMTIIFVCFTFAALLIQQSIEEARLNPVMTNVETVPIQQVPFPAITVDSGMPNPLRHSQRIFNGLAFDTIPFEDLLEADELRMKVSSVLDDMILKINISFGEYQLKDKYDYKHYKFVTLCVNHPNQTEKILLQLAKKVVFNELNDFDALLDYPGLFVALEPGEPDYEAYESCELWAERLVYFLDYLLEMNAYGATGFGTFLTYLNSLPDFLVDGKKNSLFSEFLSSYTKTSVSERVSKINATSFEFVNWVLEYDFIESYYHFSQTRTKKLCQIGSFISIQKCVSDSDFRNERKECCEMFKFQSLNATEMMQIIRESLQPPSFFSKESEINEIGLDISKIPLSNILKKPNLKRIFLEENQNARILACNYANEYHIFVDMRNCSNYFQRSITNKGFGISFNLADFWTMFKATPFTETYAKTMRPKGYEDQDDIKTKDGSWLNQDQFYQGKGIQYPESSGKSNEMIMILQQEWNHDMNIEPFTVSVHDPTLLPNMINSSHEIRTGALTTFTVLPQSIVTSEDLTSNTIKERGCQFNFEGSLKLFKNYHQDGCIFECLLEQSYLAVNCTTWKYPFFNEDQQTCNYWSAFYFRMQMTNRTTIHQCQQNCPQECTKTLYTSFVSSEPFDIQDLCADKQDYFSPEYFYRQSQPNDIIRSYEEMVFGTNMSKLEFCKRTLQRIAIVRVILASNTVTSIKRSKRVTFTGHIANLGK